MAAVNTTARRPWIAFVLSLFCTGLGHVYCGQAATGLILFVASLLFVPVTIVAAHVEASTTILVGLMLVLMAVAGVYIFAVIDGVRAAKRLKGDYVLRQYNRPIIYALFIFLGIASPLGAEVLLKARVFEAFKFVGSSMSPNVLAGDRLLVNKTDYRDRSLRRGDVIAFRAPGDRRQAYVKRVIALSGDTVAVIAGEVYVNKNRLERKTVTLGTVASGDHFRNGGVFYESGPDNEYMISQSADVPQVADFPEAVVPADHCFVLGDNRGRSRDSRHFGFIPIADVIGGVRYIFSPAESWARFGSFDG